jgi:hypothetical protein
LQSTLLCFICQHATRINKNRMPKNNAQL